MESGKRKRTVSASSRKGIKLKTLSITEKLKAIDRIESGASMHMVCEEFGIKKTTYYDLKKSKEKIRAYNREMEKPKKGENVKKRMTVSKYEDLDKAVFKWYKQHRSVVVNVRGVDIQDAASRFAKHLEIDDFKNSAGWLYRFQRRHCINTRVVHGEIASANEAGVDSFRKKFISFVKESGLLLSQIYNADESGLYWRAPPSKTLASQNESHVPGRKVAKDRISVLFCANADGSHRLKPMVIGKAKKPRCLKNILDKLPVHYDANKSAWFTQEIFSRWFHRHACREIIHDQTTCLKISRENVKAVILLDNAPAHPCVDELCSKDGKIKVMFLPPNTTSLIQPMDQGIIESCKRFYRSKMMKECFVVLETEGDAEEDTRGLRTLQNLKNYNLRNAIYNLHDAWQQVGCLTLANGWKKLLEDTDIVLGFTGFEVPDFVDAMKRAGQKEVSENDIISWLDMDIDDDGCHHKTEEEIAQEVTAQKDAHDDDDDDDEDGGSKFPHKLSEIRSAMDMALAYVNYNIHDSEAQGFYSHLRDFRGMIIRRQHSQQKQVKIHDFFKPMPKRRAVTAVPSTSTSSDSSSALQIASVSSGSTDTE